MNEGIPIANADHPKYTQDARIQMRHFCEPKGIDPKRVVGYSDLSDDERVQSILDLIGDNICRDCIFECGDCGTCVITGYPPEPEQCMNENTIRERLGLVGKEG